MTTGAAGGGGGGRAGSPSRRAPTRADLARKYATLLELRRRRDAGGDAAGGGALRALAAEFPGCLRELDTLGLPELERRARACAAGTPEEPNEPWMDWIAAYHALMRGALAVRTSGRTTHPPTPAASGGALAARADAAAGDAPALAAIASRAAGLALDEGFVTAVLAPPGGRVGVVVLRALAARFGVPAPEIASALFPVRRPSPYVL